MEWLLWLVGGIAIGAFCFFGAIVLGIMKINRIHKELEELTDLEDEER